jgi:transposase
LRQAAKAQISANDVLHRCRYEFRQGPSNAFPGTGKRRWEEGRVVQLERKIGQ